MRDLIEVALKRGAWQIAGEGGKGFKAPVQNSIAFHYGFHCDGRGGLWPMRLCGVPWPGSQADIGGGFVQREDKIHMRRICTAQFIDRL